MQTFTRAQIRNGTGFEKGVRFVLVDESVQRALRGLEIEAERGQKDAQLQEIGKSVAESIAEMVTALECDYDRLEELRGERSDWLSENPGKYLDPNDPRAKAGAHWALAFPDESEELAELSAAPPAGSAALPLLSKASTRPSLSPCRLEIALPCAFAFHARPDLLGRFIITARTRSTLELPGAASFFHAPGIPGRVSPLIAKPFFHDTLSSWGSDCIASSVQFGAGHLRAMKARRYLTAWGAVTARSHPT